MIVWKSKRPPAKGPLEDRVLIGGEQPKYAKGFQFLPVVRISCSTRMNKRMLPAMPHSGMDEEDYFQIASNATMSPTKARSYASRGPGWQPASIPEPEGHRMVSVGSYNRVRASESTLRHVGGLLLGFFAVHLGAIAIVVVLGLAANYGGLLGMGLVIGAGTVVHSLLRRRSETD